MKNVRLKQAEYERDLLVSPKVFQLRSVSERVDPSVTDFRNIKRFNRDRLTRDKMSQNIKDFQKSSINYKMR